MTVEIQELHGEPIIVCAIRLPHSPMDDVRASQEAVSAFKKKMGGQHVYRVIDLSLFNLSFSEAVMGMAADRSTDGGINDPDISTIYVGSGEMVKFGAKAFQEQDQYGQTNVIYVCSTVDEGIAFVRAGLKK